MMTLRTLIQTSIVLILALTIYQPAWAQLPFIGGDIELVPTPSFGIEKDIPVLGNKEGLYNCTAPTKTGVKKRTAYLCACPTTSIKIGEWTCKLGSNVCNTCGTAGTTNKECADLSDDLSPFSKHAFQDREEIVINNVSTAEECWALGGNYFADNLATDSTQCRLPFSQKDLE